MLIEKAVMSDLEAMSDFYYQVTTYLEATINYPGWISNVYPAKIDALNSIENNTLYVVRDGNRIAASFILNHVTEAGYNEGNWHIEAALDEMLVVHTLCVHPDYLRRGLASMMVEKAIEEAKRQGVKTVRLDVYEDNEPAMRLYERYGFKECGKADMRIGNNGPEWCILYELVLI